MSTFFTEHLNVKDEATTWFSNTGQITPSNGVQYHRKQISQIQTTLNTGLLNYQSSHSTGQESPFLLWIPTVQQHIRKTQPRVPTLSQMIPVHIPIPCFV